MSWVYFDGAAVRESDARIAATDRGLLFARGVFETFRAERDRPVFRLGRHIARMKAGAAALGITSAPERADVERAVEALLDRCGLQEARVRATLTAGPEDGAPSLLVQARPLTDYPEALYETGAAAVVAKLRRNETSPLCRVKSLNYLDNLLAREEARRAGAVEALLLNTQGRLAEGSASNVFLVRDGVLVTPPLDDGALPGVTREAVLDLARAEGIPAEEAPVEPDALTRATEAFITNAVAGVLPVTSVDGAAVGGGTPGEVTRRLRAALRRAAE